MNFFASMVFMKKHGGASTVATRQTYCGPAGVVVVGAGVVVVVVAVDPPKRLFKNAKMKLMMSVISSVI